MTTNPNIDNPYAILGLSNFADSAAIQERGEQLCKELNITKRDLMVSHDAPCKKLNAWRILSHPALKAVVDKILAHIPGSVPTTSPAH